MTWPLVLIVDDNPANLTVLGELLQPQHAIRVANSGVRALRLARLKPQPGLILPDVMMPEMDGYEVLRQLRAHPETAGIPVIFLTALTGPAAEQRGRLHGAAAYVTKPVVPALLLDLVHQQLQAAAPGTGPGPASPHLLRIGRQAAALAQWLRQPPASPLPAGLQAGAPLAALTLLAILDTQDPQAQALALALSQALSQALALLAPGAAAPSGFESRWRQGQGGERWVETRLHRCALAGPIRVLCVSRDGRGWRSRSTSAPRSCAWR